MREESDIKNLNLRKNPYMNSLSENELLDFLRLFADDNTLALVESEIIANNPNRKHYNSLTEILAEIEEIGDDVDNTLAKMESDMLVNDPNAKRYSSFREFMDEINI